MTDIRWHGRGGQGCFTASRILGMAAALYEKKYALAFPTFGPERRGAPVVAFTRISEHTIRDRSELQKCDYCVILDETLIDDSILNGLKDTGSVFVNTTTPHLYPQLQTVHSVPIDATSMALRILGKPITNTALLGLLVTSTGIVSMDSIHQAFKHSLSPEAARLNTLLISQVFEQFQKGNTCQ